MSLTGFLKDAGAVGALYFLVTMLLALVYSDEAGANARATIRAVGLGLSLLAMMAAAIIEPATGAGPAELPLPGRPPRVPGVPEDEIQAVVHGLPSLAGDPVHSSRAEGPAAGDPNQTPGQPL